MKKLIFSFLGIAILLAFTPFTFAKTGIIIHGNDGSQTFISSDKFTAVEFESIWNNEGASEIAGTTWTVLTDTGKDFENLTITFNNNGKVTFNNYADPNDGVWTYATWEYSDQNLKIVLGEGEPDDYFYGNFVINGTNATYTYSWYDCNGSWGGENTYVMTLLKK